MSARSGFTLPRSLGNLVLVLVLVLVSGCVRVCGIVDVPEVQSVESVRSAFGSGFGSFVSVLPYMSGRVLRFGQWSVGQLEESVDSIVRECPLELGLDGNPVG